MQRIDRQGMFQIRNHQLLMLLFMIQSDFDHARDVRGCVGDAGGHRVIHMASVGHHVGQRRAADHAALFTRERFTDTVVIRIE